MSSMVREWIIFAISLGLGGHIVLALVLHAPESWPWDKAGLYGLLVGLSVYISFQLSRSLWWMIKGRAKVDPSA
ncbi:MAG: hypothetical protein AB1411_16405 [Nitrospirota bacterium]